MIRKFARAVCACILGLLIACGLGMDDPLDPGCGITECAPEVGP